jgi:hypothetical protein
LGALDDEVSFGVRGGDRSGRPRRLRRRNASPSLHCGLRILKRPPYARSASGRRRIRTEHSAADNSASSSRTGNWGEACEPSRRSDRFSTRPSCLQPLLRSWPRSSRPSTPLAPAQKGVDARNKSGHERGLDDSGQAACGRPWTPAFRGGDEKEKMGTICPGRVAIRGAARRGGR